MRTVTVKSGNYKVLIGPGLLREAGERIAQSVRGKRCAVVTDDRVGPLYAKPLISSLEAAGIRLCAGVQGEADAAVQQFLQGTLDYVSQAQCDHHGHGEGHDCGHHAGGSCGSGSCHA